MTTREAKNIIKYHKDNTSYFDGTITRDDMYNMLRYRMRFGESETEVILAALVLAGADFKEDECYDIDFDIVLAG